MSEWRRVKSRGRRDVNEPELIDEYERLGCKVYQLSGEDIPDLLIGFLGRWHLDEVKFEDAPLRSGQQTWHDEAAKYGERPTVTRTRAHARKNVKMWTLEFSRLSRLEAMEEERR